MIRVLHIFHEMSNGGIERFVMNYYRHIDKSRVQFDFLVSVDREGYFDDEIAELGGHVFHAYPLKKNPIRNYCDIARIVKENNYKIVHRHTGSAFGYLDLRAAKYGGAQCLILHSHNNRAGNMLLHHISDTLLKIPCEKLACSKDAGNWLYGVNTKFKVVNNAIDCAKFQFDKEMRDNIRRELGISEKFVVGHVGRFSEQKNHRRLFEIFKEVYEQDNNTVLICVGAGELLEQSKKLVDELGVGNKIFFLGARTDINVLMQAFDVFVLPSIYEGLPFVLVEAQASGLHCVVSERVPKECDITGNVCFKDLGVSNFVWAEAILNNKTLEREKYAFEIAQHGYDIKINAAALCDYYESLNRQ